MAKKKKRPHPAVRTGFLFAKFGDAVGIDIVPMLSKLTETDAHREALLKGRDDYFKATYRKAKKKKAAAKKKTSSKKK